MLPALKASIAKLFAERGFVVGAQRARIAAIDRFTAHVTSVFLGPDRALSKRYLKLLVDRIETDGHEVSIHAREGVLTALIEKRPPSSEDELFRTCDPTWLREQDSLVPR